MNAWVLVGGRVAHTRELERRRAERPGVVIAADGGIRHASALRVTPDAWVGDFDSSDPRDARFIHVPREVVPRDKDFTDAELALRVARAHGATHVTFWGAFGGRADHSLALMILALREAGAGLKVELHSGDESGSPLLPDRTVVLRAEPGQVISVVAFDDLEGLSVRGVRWPLDDALVPAGSGWTISNEATGSEVRCHVSSGRALVTQSWT